MKANLLKFSIVLITATLLLAPAFAGADVFMKEKQHTDGMTIMGQAQPAQDRTVTTWITQDKMRRDEGEMSSLAIVEKGKMVVYHINHPQKLYTEMSLGSDDIQELASGMSGEIKVKVTPTGESKKIGSWNCKKYIQEMDMGMMPMASEIWATEDIKIPFQDIYEKFGSAMVPAQPGMKMSMQAMQEEMKKMKGLPVLTNSTMRMMQNVTMKTSRELLEIKDGTAPAGTFDLPAGYKKQEMPRDMGQGRMPVK